MDLYKHVTQNYDILESVLRYFNETLGKEGWYCNNMVNFTSDLFFSSMEAKDVKITFCYIFINVTVDWYAISKTLSFSKTLGYQDKLK